MPHAPKAECSSITYFMYTGLGVLLAGSFFVLAAMAWPVRSNNPAHQPGHRQSLPEIRAEAPDLQPLLAKVAGSRLIRPAQVQPAVKDTGAAQELLERLKLQSIVRAGAEPIAYVRVKDSGVQKVRRGGHLLDFLVEEIESGQVKLQLDGVVVDLTY